MKDLVFIRHAETDLAGTFCGHLDAPVNSRGHMQIRDMISHLGSEPFEAIYSSDLRRAVETATLLAQVFALPVVTTERLREICFGDWEGLTWDDIEQRDASYARHWATNFPSVTAPNGESFTHFERRVLEELGHLLYIAESKRIAVVTHGGVMRIVLRAIFGYSETQVWEMTKPYCSFFVCSELTVPHEVRR
jgi:alpha-ribazole phosphatase/probable phosphoglycerate mutase